MRVKEVRNIKSGPLDEHLKGGEHLQLALDFGFLHAHLRVFLHSRLHSLYLLQVQGLLDPLMD